MTEIWRGISSLDPQAAALVPDYAQIFGVAWVNSSFATL